MVINGKVEEMDVFESTPLFLKQWPKLLRSYALDAVLSGKADAAKSCSTKEAVRFMDAAMQAGVKAKYKYKGDGGLVITARESKEMVIFSVSEHDSAAASPSGFNAGIHSVLCQVREQLWNTSIVHLTLGFPFVGAWVGGKASERSHPLFMLSWLPAAALIGRRDDHRRCETPPLLHRWAACVTLATLPPGDYARRNRIGGGAGCPDGRRADILFVPGVVARRDEMRDRDNTGSPAADLPADYSLTKRCPRNLDGSHSKANSASRPSGRSTRLSAPHYGAPPIPSTPAAPAEKPANLSSLQRELADLAARCWRDRPAKARPQELRGPVIVIRGK